MKIDFIFILQINFYSPIYLPLNQDEKVVSIASGKSHNLLLTSNYKKNHK